MVTTDPALAPAALLAELQQLCDMVLRSDDVKKLADFAADFDQVGARTFACLLYTFDRIQAALYWWRFAAGAGDPLAAHLLAVHHAACGNTPQARIWRALARLARFDPLLHMPTPVRDRGHTADDFVRNSEFHQIQTFMRMTTLPKELVA
ncbi:hypothetical protein D7294_29815 [Streptomyces hoynatensis]|uniref:Uncharacterized protein n=1 Tax=Streptomyces hoynatensis TaxID=1141874 RepID=A0A3A9YIF6_9ACTN|nr:hypothetical protein D7294_29815 [Streptomyces hoynatensis]